MQAHPALAASSATPVDHGLQTGLYVLTGLLVLGAAIARSLRGAPLAHAWALPRVARPLLLLGIAIAIAALTWEPTATARFVLDRVGTLRSLFRLAFNVSVNLAVAAARPGAGG